MHTIHCASRSTARRHFPAAVVIARVCGGFIAFDSRAEYLTWRAQP
jgi:hypothetical protein